MRSHSNEQLEASKDLTINERNIEDLVNTVSQFSDQAIENSRVAVDKSVELVKEYPVHAAIGAGVLGFMVGMISKKILR
ncbi:MAG: hypothetical protein CME62_06765 [Halobacteriovoraceae bacterium]|nr:hypothetical protein [Halobacteriovoraceae bacterium]|tara:strand:- start:3977 stop:4213 length:237 start_codon:yes stop_codon:yes gene_type:complete